MLEAELERLNYGLSESGYYVRLGHDIAGYYLHLCREDGQAADSKAYGLAAGQCRRMLAFARAMASLAKGRD
jgi:hypothetical protein